MSARRSWNLGPFVMSDPASIFVPLGADDFLVPAALISGLNQSVVRSNFIMIMRTCLFTNFHGIKVKRQNR